MRMDVMTRSYVLAAPALALLTPGLEHCEACHRPDQPYGVLWLVLVRTGAFARANHYQPGQGWNPGARRRVINPAVTTLYDLLTQRDRTLDLADYEVLRADLLAILAAMHHEQIHKRLDRSPAASPAALRPELDHVLNLLDRNWRRPITVRQLAQLARMAPNYLNRLFRQRTGRSIHRYLTDRRMAEALRLCRQRTLSVKEVAAKVGYEDPLYFSRAFRRFHGRPPSEA
jgi:AraC-like DNA-binding protein